MKKLLGVVVMVLCVFGLCGSSPAADQKDALAMVDKAIQAIGGEEKLSKIVGFSAKMKGTISFNGSDNPFTVSMTAQGLENSRQEFETEFNGNPVKGVTVFTADKGWRDFGGNHMDLDKESLANEKQRHYMTLIPITIMPLKSKDFTLETVPEEKVDDKPAVGVKVTGPDKKDFTLFFDKESGLPVKMIAKVAGFDGQEFTQETLFTEYKEMAGIKKATKVISKRDGTKFMAQEITEFKVLDKIEPKTFTDL